MRGLNAAGATSPGFRLPLLDLWVPLSSSGVRILAAAQLLAGAGLVAALTASALPAGRDASFLSLALSVLILAATVPALLDGRLRFPLAGAGSLLLGIVAAMAGGLGGSPLATGLAWMMVVISGCTAVYHLLGADPPARDA